MAFDGIPPRAPDLVILIDNILASFGPNGEHWIQGMPHDDKGGMCIIGAHAVARRYLHINVPEFRKLFTKALRRVNLYPCITSIAEFNDDDHTRFEHVRGILIVMRKLALGEEVKPSKVERVLVQDQLIGGLAALSAISRGEAFSLSRIVHTKPGKFAPYLESYREKCRQEGMIYVGTGHI